MKRRRGGRLPDGTITQDAQAHLAAWKIPMCKIEKLLHVRIFGVDPGFAVGVTTDVTFSLPTSIGLRLAEIWDELEELRKLRKTE